MSHTEQMMFFNSVFEVFPELSKGRILDVGSFNINGGPRLLLAEPLECVGVDVCPGPNVNLVSGSQDLALLSNHFDNAMSSECFEHTPYWIATFQNMIRMTKPGGIVAFSCATVGRPEHGAPVLMADTRRRPLSELAKNFAGTSQPLILNTALKRASLSGTPIPSIGEPVTYTLQA